MVQQERRADRIARQDVTAVASQQARGFDAPHRRSPARCRGGGRAGRRRFVGYAEAGVDCGRRQPRAVDEHAIVELTGEELLGEVGRPPAPLSRREPATSGRTCACRIPAPPRRSDPGRCPSASAAASRAVDAVELAVSTGPLTVRPRRARNAACPTTVPGLRHRPRALTASDECPPLPLGETSPAAVRHAACSPTPLTASGARRSSTGSPPARSSAPARLAPQPSSPVLSGTRWV